MSDTPRTDEEILDPEIVHQDSHSEGWVSIDFARQLERELNAAKRDAEATVRAVKDAAGVEDGRGALEEISQMKHRIGQLERRLDEAKHRIRGLIAERDSARIEAGRNWKLRDEFEALLGTNDVAAGVADIKQLKRDAARYQVVRKMNASQFAELLQRCLFQDLRFDDEVDRLAAIRTIKMHLKVKEGGQ